MAEETESNGNDRVLAEFARTFAGLDKYPDLEMGAIMVNGEVRFKDCNGFISKGEVVRRVTSLDTYFAIQRDFAAYESTEDTPVLGEILIPKVRFAAELEDGGLERVCYKLAEDDERNAAEKEIEVKDFHDNCIAFSETILKKPRAEAIRIANTMRQLYLNEILERQRRVIKTIFNLKGTVDERDKIKYSGPEKAENKKSRVEKEMELFGDIFEQQADAYAFGPAVQLSKLYAEKAGQKLSNHQKEGRVRAAARRQIKLHITAREELLADAKDLRAHAQEYRDYAVQHFGPLETSEE